jgi:hypothetical protein
LFLRWGLATFTQASLELVILLPLELQACTSMPGLSISNFKHCAISDDWICLKDITNILWLPRPHDEHVKITYSNI